MENPCQPVALVIKTIKGKGVQETQESPSGGHGYPLKAFDPKLPHFLREIYGSEKLPSQWSDWVEEIISSQPKKKETPKVKGEREKVQAGLARAAIQCASEGLPIISVSSDLAGSTGMAAFQKKFPHQKIDVGVAEANMISVGIGLSKQGFIPIVDTFGQFGITKGNLPLIMAGLSQAPLVAVFSHTGFQDAADGASHQATTYLSAVSSIPYVNAVVCSCSQEAQNYMAHVLKDFALQREKGEIPPSTIFFVGRENFPTEYKKDLSYTYGEIQVLKKGSDALLVTNGPLVPKALAAADELAQQGHHLTVVNNPFVNNPPTRPLAELLSQNKNRLITLEDHQLIAGAGAMLSHALLLSGSHFQLKSLGHKGSFGQSAYGADDLYKSRSLDKKAIINTFLSML